MFKWVQDMNVTSASRVTRSPSKKKKVSIWFNISDILSYIPEMTSSSPIH